MSKNLNCVCDAHAPLKPAQLEPGLPSRQCGVCEGSLLEMADYRRWSSRPGVAPTTGDQSIELAEADAPVARACPSCTRLMQRLRTGSSTNFRVDRCFTCQLVWFDRGEWPALVQAGLAGRLAELLSDGAQRQLMADELRAGRIAALRERHGEARLQELQRIRDWLEAQPEPDELLNLLRTGW